MKAGVRAVARKKIAVITARADDSEQSEIIAGIAETAFSCNADIAVFTNLYNHWTDDPVLNFENHIYDLCNPAQFDGVIVTAEAFCDLHMLHALTDKIRAAGIPAVMISGEAAGFVSIHSDDAADAEQIAEHLITVHGLTRFDILTGFAENPVSHTRAAGCRRAFARHGIAFSEAHLFYGNFWTDSGEALAARYLSGELEMPEAVICTNDYMAFGLCDALTAAGVRIPEQITVTGYDYTPGRIFHYPILTSFRRGRRQLGQQAAALVLSAEMPEYPQENRLIPGNTCACGADSAQMNSETVGARIGQYHAVTSSMAQFTSDLTMCRTLYEYTSVLHTHFYLLHGADTLFLCLSDSRQNRQLHAQEYLCCTVRENGFSEQPQHYSPDALFPALTAAHDRPMLYIFTPLCFQSQLLGTTVLCYSRPQSYDFSYRDWNKTVVTTLEFLRMKDDIHYLQSCRSVSQLYDALTGFCTRAEFRRIAEASGADDCRIYAIQLTFADDLSYQYGENYRSDMIAKAAKAIGKSAKHHEICCRAAEHLFLVLCRPEDAEVFAETLGFQLYHAISSAYDERQVLVTQISRTGTEVECVIADAGRTAAEALEAFRQRQQLPHFAALTDIRAQLCRDPKHARTAEELSRQLCKSIGYFRAGYKQCFAVSYAQDVIRVRAYLAQYLLCTTAMSVYAVALECGYSDEKYFSRQFKQCTGLSPTQYRAKYR